LIKRLVMYDESKGSFFEDELVHGKYEATLTSIRWGKNLRSGISRLWSLIEYTEDPSEHTVEKALEFLKTMKLNDLKLENEARIEEGFLFLGDFFSFSKDKDQANFSQQTSILSFKKAMGMNTSANKIQWKTENNGLKIFTEEQFLSICLASETHKRNHIQNFWVESQRLLATEFKSFKEIAEFEFRDIGYEVPAEQVNLT
jgi:hypothetical protein